MSKYSTAEKRALLTQCNRNIAKLTVSRPFKHNADGAFVCTDVHSDRKIIAKITGYRALALSLRGAADPTRNPSGSSL